MNREIHFWTVDKYKQEEAWLNELSRQGKALVKNDFGIRYTFEECEKGQWQYKILFNEDLTKRRDLNAFLAENGIEQVGKYLYWSYYRKRNDGTPFELFNTKGEELRQMNKVLRFATILKVLMTADLLMCLMLGFFERFRNWPLLLLVGVIFAFIYNVHNNLKNQVQLLERDADIYE